MNPAAFATALERPRTREDIAALWVVLKDKRDRMEAAFEEAKRELREVEREFVESFSGDEEKRIVRLAERSVWVESRTWARVTDKYVAIDALRPLGLVKEEPRLWDLHSYVRDQIKTGGSLPLGVDFAIDDVVRSRRRPSATKEESR